MKNMDIYNKTSDQHKEMQANGKFIARYASKTLTLRDRYCHLVQLLAIYQALEEKLKVTKFGKSLEENDKLKHLLNCSTQIEKDLIALNKKAHGELDKLLMDATKTLVEKINAMTNPEEILAYFLIPILGNIYGGYYLSNSFTDLLKAHGLFNENKEENGVSIYDLPDQTKIDLNDWLQKQTLSDNINQFPNDGFAALLKIYDELEKKRVDSPFLPRFSTFAKKDSSLNAELNPSSYNPLKQSR